MTFEEMDAKSIEDYGKKFIPIVNFLWSNKSLVYGLFIHNNDSTAINRLIAGMASMLVMVREFGVPDDLPGIMEEEKEEEKVEGGELGNFDIGDIVGHKPDDTEESSG